MPLGTTDTRYAHNGGVHLAYQVLGEGPPDFVLCGGITHVELTLEPPFSRAYERLATFGRVVAYDQRGIGLSDPVPIPDHPDHDADVADLMAVLDDAGIERAVLLGVTEGARVAIHAAATQPDRCDRLVVFNALARHERGDGYPFGNEPEELDNIARLLAEVWLGGEAVYELAPSQADDEEFRAAFRRYSRAALRPGEVEAYFRSHNRSDLVADLPHITAPTLVLYRAGNKVVGPQGVRFVAERIAGARYVEVPGEDYLFLVGDVDALVDEIREFVTGSRAGAEPARLLATIVVTDIVDSTGTASRLGDRKWRDVLDGHDRVVREELHRFGGREIKATGDGFLATFTDPVAAIGCGRAVSQRVGRLGIAVRVGIHTGMCEVRGADVGGLAVHIADRIQANACPGEVLVSSTVKDLVLGTGVSFEDRGAHELKGVPGEWQLFACTS